MDICYPTLYLVEESSDSNAGLLCIYPIRYDQGILERDTSALILDKAKILFSMRLVLICLLIVSYSEMIFGSSLCVIFLNKGPEGPWKFYLLWYFGVLARGAASSNITTGGELSSPRHSREKKKAPEAALILFGELQGYIRDLN